MKTWRTCVAVCSLVAGSAWGPGTVRAVDAAGHVADLWIVTTPAGAGLAAGASVDDFPLLVRLSRGTFDFAQADAAGADIHFTDAAGTRLVHAIEEWDPERGVASVWVRIPRIEGDTQQAIRMNWGGAAPAAATPGEVFDAVNRYAAVLHLGERLGDEIGTIRPEDKGTQAVPGLIGACRRCAAGAGISGGDDIAGLPAGKGPMTTQAWFRATQANGRIVGWGKERKQGNKIIVEVASPPRITLDCFFANVEGRTVFPLGDWHQVVHTFDGKNARVYLDGRLDGESAPPLDLSTPASFFIGGWYGRYGFVGDVDEVRISSVARSPEWIRLEYENQKPLQSLVGPPVAGSGPAAVTPARLDVPEGGSVTVNANPGGARRWSWSVVRGGVEREAAVDEPRFTFAAGRVTGDERFALRFRAVQPDGVQVIDVPVTVREAIPEPTVSLRAPRTWDGRTPIEVEAVIGNRAVLAEGAAAALPLATAWTVTGGAVTHRAAGTTLTLARSQYSGPITVRAVVDNGGRPATAEAVIEVAEPDRDAWVAREPAGDEQPADGQFYARDDSNRGTLVWNGRLDVPAAAVRLDVRADGKPYASETCRPAADGTYAFAVGLAPGLVTYEAELATVVDGGRTVLRTARDLVCGDVLVIQGQSNALATDTREQAPRETHPWIRSHGEPPAGDVEPRPNGWCRPVWKREQPTQTEIGWWGMELGKRLVEHHRVPVCILNGAVGGTRIDQHQRNDANPADPATIYGRLLRRARAAGLTHGIRAILWHQGENNQGAAGPSGDHDWKTYQDLFLDLAADWKEDFPNLRHYYVFQIWPSACAMGRDGNGDMLREKQRTLPRLFSHMDIQATLGVRPPGGCHFPLEGWAEFARLVEPLVARDFHGVRPAGPVTSPNLVRATTAEDAPDSVALEFDQPVVWRDDLAGQFCIDGAAGRVTGGRVEGSVLRLAIGPGPAPRNITYVREASWRQDALLVGENGLAALTFCDVAVSDRPGDGAPLAAAPPRPRLRIINGTDHAVDVFWLESDTRRVPSGSIPPGQDTTITTTLGHRFVVVDREDRSESTVTSEVPVQAFRVGGVPGFYTQRVEAHGFPIVASANVNRFALEEAAHLVDMMLAKRPDVREAMIKSGARLSIIAWNEFTTDQPEWRWLGETPVAGFRDIAARDYYDARARGMGGSETDPFCSCAEENLLCYPGDPYSTECILIHEFAHNIHLRGMVNVDPSFDARVKAAYDAAMREGLWKGKYASVNHHEYFAEGVQSWFDNNREHDHDHNHVDTRDELAAYDPRLAALCREVFGDTVLKYTKPQTRLVGHLAGYDPATAPRFEWPERLSQAREEIRRRARARDAAANAADAGESPPGSERRAAAGSAPP